MNSMNLILLFHLMDIIKFEKMLLNNGRVSVIR